MATISHAYLIAAVAFDRELRGNWFGLAFGNAITLAQPKFQVGGWLLTYGGRGDVHQLALGARSGFFDRKPDREWFNQVGGLLFSVADFSVLQREAEIGPLEYATELGLRAGPDDKHAEDASRSTSQPSHGGVAAALKELEELRDGGLVTADEYEGKRADILSRL